MKTKKSTAIVSAVAIITIAIMVIGATFAYFRAQGGSAVTKDVQITAHTVDRLSFYVDQDINIEVSQLDFQSGGNNKSGDATATAILTPNSKTGAATRHYYVYLQLDTNEIDYSVANTNHQAELLLQVFDDNNQLVTITKLGSQVTVGSLTGYDITGLEGLYALLDNHEITASNFTETEENWHVVITMINHAFKQNDNAGKQVRGNIIVSEESLDPPTPTEVLLGKYALTEPGNATLSNGMLYYHDENLEYGAEDYSYRYAGVNPDNFLCFGSDATPCPSTNLYRIIGLIPVDVVTNATTNPVTTEKKALYKVIKYDYLTSSESSNGLGTSISDPNLGTLNTYYWTGSSANQVNSWVTSTANTITLNTDFYGTLAPSWQNKIATVMWKVGGTDEFTIYFAHDAFEVYNNEINYSGVDNHSLTEEGIEWDPEPTGTINYPSKIGLVYASDVYYTALAAEWSDDVTSGYHNMWMGRGDIYELEWTITRSLTNDQDVLVFAFTNDSTGYGIVDHASKLADPRPMRPSFYLKEDVVIDMESHAGTISDPFRIN